MLRYMCISLLGRKLFLNMKAFKAAEIYVWGFRAARLLWEGGPTTDSGDIEGFHGSGKTGVDCHRVNKSKWMCRVDDGCS